MLLLALIALTAGKVSVLSFNQYLINKYASKSTVWNESDPEVIITDPWHLHEVPKHMHHRCTFEVPVPEFYVLKSETIEGRSVCLAQDLDHHRLVRAALNEFSVPVDENISNCKYLITGSDTSYGDFDTLTDDLDFLHELKDVLHVYSGKPTNLTNEICRNRWIHEKYFALAFVLTFVSLVAVRILVKKQIRRYKEQAFNGLWIFDHTKKIIHGKALETISPFARRRILSIISKSQQLNKCISTVFSMKRKSETQVFNRALAIPFTRYHTLVALWDEEVSDITTLTFDCTFEADHYETQSAPTSSWSSFRDAYPVKVEFTLDNNCMCQIKLPSTAVTTFYPYGHCMTIFCCMCTSLYKYLSNDPSDPKIFKEFTQTTAKIMDLNRVIVFDENKECIINYQKEMIRNYRACDVLDFVNMIDAKNHFFSVNDAFGEGSRCIVFQMRTEALRLDFFIDLPDALRSDYFEEYLLRSYIFTSSLCYQLFAVKGMTMKLERLVNMFTQVKPYFAISEYSYPSKKLLWQKCPMLDSAGESNDILEFIRENTNTDAFDNFCKDLYETVAYRGMITGRVIPLSVNGEQKLYSLSAKVTGVSEDGEQILTVLTQDITDIIAKEKEEREILQSAAQVESLLGTYKLVRRAGEVYFEDKSLYTALKLDPPDGTEYNLKDLVHNEDFINIDKVCRGQKSVFRLVSGQGDLIWFYAVMKSDTGFMFNIDELTDIRNRLKNKKTIVSSDVNTTVLWRVDLDTDVVIPMFHQNTIWNALSVAKDKSFSTFPEFIEHEGRQDFIEAYERIKSGEIWEWSGELNLLVASRGYQYHKVFMARCEMDRTLHCIAINISKKKEQEKSIEETKRYQELLLTCCKMILWKFTDDSHDLPAIGKFEPGVINMNWSVVEKSIHPDYRALFTEKMKRLLSDKEEYIQMDVPILVEDGDFWVSIRGKMYAQSRQVIGIAVDISDLRTAYDELAKETQRAVQANHNKTQFLSNMSHEIRTPMNGIFGLLDVLALEDLSNEQKLLVDSIRSSSLQLMKLLDETLNLSKIEQGTIEYNPQIFNLTKIFEPICIATASRARLNNLKFIVKVDKKFPKLVYGNQQFFMQILNNLLSNSLKFTKKGYISVELGWTYGEVRDMLTISVSDSGIGISEEQKRHIFERFEQADRSTARFFGGTGLGLSLVRDITRFLDGQISLTSTPYEKTEFRVEIPFQSVLAPYSPPFTDHLVHLVLVNCVDDGIFDSILEWLEYHRYTVIRFTDPSEIDSHKKEGTAIDAIILEGNTDRWPEIAEHGKGINIISLCEAGEPVHFEYSLAKPVQMPHLLRMMHSFRFGFKNASSVAAAARQESIQKRVLVVEDNKTNQFVMKKILTSLNCSFEIAENGKEAIDILDEQNFDLVFMDCQMPVLDGLEATRRIRRSSKVYASIPVIALTASAIEGDEQHCREAGMDWYLAKPVRRAQIAEVMKRF